MGDECLRSSRCQSTDGGSQWEVSQFSEGEDNKASKVDEADSSIVRLTKDGKTTLQEIDTVFWPVTIYSQHKLLTLDTLLRLVALTHKR